MVILMKTVDDIFFLILKENGNLERWEIYSK